MVVSNDTFHLHSVRTQMVLPKETVMDAPTNPNIEQLYLERTIKRMGEILNTLIEALQELRPTANEEQRVIIDKALKHVGFHY